MNIKKRLKRIFAFCISMMLLLNTSMFTGYASVIKNTPASNFGPGVNLFEGAEITMLKNSSRSQMMGYIISTKNGKLIVVDGGLDLDAPHLKELLKNKGGIVSAWLLTHPHSDHIGALNSILNEEGSGITIEGIYYNMTDINWYKRNEAYRADTVENFMQTLSRVNPSILHPNVKRGDTIQVDDATINVLNAPYLFTVNSINNSSVAYRIDMQGKRILFLGDMGEQAGNSLMSELHASELKSDLVQMAHHGQYGVSKELYQVIRPDVAMWNAPEWLWNNDNGGGIGSGPWKTLEVRKWMQEIGVKRNYIIKDGDQIIR